MLCLSCFIIILLLHKTSLAEVFMSTKVNVLAYWTGIKPYWADLTNEVMKLKELFTDAVASIRDSGEQWVEEVVEDDLPAALTHGKLAMVVTLCIILVVYSEC